MSLVEEGRLELDGRVGDHLPTFASVERRIVTLRHLLSHTSGLPDLLRLWIDEPDPVSRRRAVLEAPLRHRVGSTFEYSCVGYLVAGFLVEAVTGRTLSELVSERICGPLGLADTGFQPMPERLARVAATEDQRAIGRGMIRGSVHDENSWSLGGTGGNAGIFSTAGDLARFGEAIRRGGELDGRRMLSEAGVAEMLRDQLPSGIDPGYRQGLGFRIAAPDFMGALAESGAVGHTGFTGTSIVIDRSRQLVVVLLTNRVHPSREWSDLSDIRQRVTELAAMEPVPSRPRR
jgi:CubicO group peptidase (beta-lactamase class C family)